MDDVTISGVGMHPFGRFPDLSAIDLAVTAVLEALDDADLKWNQIEAVYCGHMYAGTGAGHRLVAQLGRTGIPIINIENACSSGSAAVQQARMALQAGRYSRALAVGLEKMPRGFMSMDYFEPWRRASGHAVNPAQFALAIRRHMHDYGTTEQQLAAVAVKNHQHSVGNDRAMYQHAIAEGEILASRLITDPLRLLMMCTPNEGAAAAVLETGSRPGGVRVLGAGLRTATLWQSIGEHMPTSSPISEFRVPRVTELAAQDAYAEAGVGPADIDVAEVQDTDSGTEIIASEDLGFCAPGQGGHMAASGESSLGGRLPINPSGGLLSKGEPVGASGLGQIYEIVNQLRGRCGERQVAGARIGLTHAMGAGGNSSVLGAGCHPMISNALSRTPCLTRFGGATCCQLPDAQRSTGGVSIVSTVMDSARERIGWTDEPRRHIIEASAVRRFREAVGEDPNPDSDVVPTTYLLAVGWKAPFERIPEAYEHGTTWLNAGDTFEYYQPVTVGSVLDSQTSLDEVFSRDGGTGTLLFFVFNTDYADEAGELVARHVGTRVRR